MTEKRTIKKYPNRRLYDTTISSYITLEDVRRLITLGFAIDVVDAKTEKNLTHSTLVQIMVDQEEKHEHLFSLEVLEKLIRCYGTPSQSVMSDFLVNSLKVMEEYQQEHPSDTVASIPKSTQTTANVTYQQVVTETD